MQLNEHFNQKKQFRKRLINLILVLALLTLILIIRLVTLQLIHHDKYTTLSQRNLLNTIPLPPARGLIYDRNHILLAKNEVSYSLNIIPAKANNVTKLLHKLTQILPISQHDLHHFYRALPRHHNYDSIPLKLHLTEQQVATFYVNRYQLTGAQIQASLYRHYLKGKELTSVLGYEGRINKNELQHLNIDDYLDSNYIGKSGVEKYDESLLHGHVGVATVEINASGEIVRYLHKTPPTPGTDITLTIDSRLQEFIYHALGHNNGAVVAIAPDTGAILALVSKPSFNGNLFSAGISQSQFNTLLNAPDHPLYNRATHGLFSPGSTIKPFYALAALQHHIITPQTQIFDRGWFRLKNTKHIYHDWKYDGHGWVNVSKAIIVSCDTYFYELAVQMGIHLMDTTLKQFGFGSITGTDINAELTGIVPSPAWKEAHHQHPWYTGDTIITGIGQGSLLVTPLQLATATAILAERGYRAQPHLIQSIQPANQHSTQLHYPKTQVFKASHSIWQGVISAMQQVISSPHGTAVNFGPHAYTVAGKTGTAQVFGKTRNEEYVRSNIPKKLRNNHLFIAFAPVAHPKIALAVIIEHAGTADQLAGKILQFYFNLKPKAHPREPEHA